MVFLYPNDRKSILAVLVLSRWAFQSAMRFGGRRLPLAAVHAGKCDDDGSAQ